MNTLDNLLQNQHITALQYLERVPDGYIPGRRALIAEMKRAAIQPPAPPAPIGGPESGDLIAGNEAPMPIPTGGGYSALQRKVNETGTTAGLV